MRKVFFMLGFLFALGILFLAGSTMAGPKQCPPGQRGDCSYWRQKNNPSHFGCFPNNANLGQGWIFVSDKCPDKKEKEEKPTNTAKPKPSNTMLPEKPTNTPEKISDPKDGKKPAKTPEVLYVDNIEEFLACPEDCVCKLLEEAVSELDDIEAQLEVGNRLQLTLNSAVMTVAAK